MSKNHEFVYRMIIIMLSVILVMTLVQSPRTTQAAPHAAGAQMVAVTVLEANCDGRENVTTTYAKVMDFGTFTVNSAESLLELTFNGRISIQEFTASTGAVFELRVGRDASTLGRARARVANTGGSGSMQVSITGLFQGLTAGNHTASMWVKTYSGSATGAWVDPSCWSTDVVIVKEYLPFGVSFLPMITK